MLRAETGTGHSQVLDILGSCKC